MDQKPAYEDLETKIHELENKIDSMKCAEKVLHESDKLFSSVVEASKDAIIAINHFGEIIIFNPAAEKMFGYKIEEMLGEQLDLLMQESLRETHRSLISRYFEKSEKLKPIDKTRDLYALHKTGSLFPIELSLSSSLRNNKKIIIAVIRDITNRKKAEEYLKEAHKETKEANKKLGQAYAKMREWKDELSLKLNKEEIVLIIDEDGKIILFTDRVLEIIAKHRNEIFNRNICDFIETRDIETLKTGMKKALQGISQIISVYFQRHNENHIFVNARITRIGSATEKKLLFTVRR